MANGMTTAPNYANTTVGLVKLPYGSTHTLTSSNVGRGYSPVARLGTRSANYRSLPGQIIKQQASTIGTVAGAKPNPLADVANWQTGGRQTPSNGIFGAMGQGGNMLWWYAGGALVLAVVLMRRKK